MKNRLQWKKRDRPPARRRKRWAKRACGCPVRVDPEQRRHLIECCAFFRADHFREVQPGRYREQDLRDAAADIDAVLDARGVKRAAEAKHRANIAGRRST